MREKAMSRNAVYNLNRGWGFAPGDRADAWRPDYDDSGFAEVSVPHTMRLERLHPGDYTDVFQGIGWYRRYFTLEREDKGSRAVLEFDGIMAESHVYLNGRLICTRFGGYVGFSVDVTPFVRFGEENLLAVRVSSLDCPDIPPGKPLRSLDFHYYGGIYRNVRLRLTAPLFFCDPLAEEEPASGGVFVTFPQVSPEQAAVHVQVHVQNGFLEPVQAAVSCLLRDGGTEAARGSLPPVLLAPGEKRKLSLELIVRRPALWSPDAPHLYTLETVLRNGEELCGKREDAIGIRRFEAKADGFYLNGRKLFLWGANRHQCFPYVGDAAPDSMQVRDVIQMKRCGLNAVRAAHYPQSPAFLDACDRYGLLVIACQPGWQNFTDSPAFFRRTIRDARELIRRDRNHPCVFLWEISLNETVCSRAWAQEALRAAREEMPGEPLLTAADFHFHGDLYDVNYKVIDRIDGRFVDQDPQKPAMTREWGDWSGMDQACRAMGAEALTRQVLTHQRFWNGDGYPDWGGLARSPRLSGCFLWSWNDYSRGSEAQPLFSGCVETDRVEKPLFYWMQSMTDPRSPSHGPMVWLDAEPDGSGPRTVRVYSNCGAVSLYCGGRLVRTLRREEAVRAGENEWIAARGGSPVFSFPLPENAAGDLRAEGLLDGRTAAVHVRRAPGAPAKIQIEPRLMGIEPTADGSDLIPVLFRVADSSGAPCPAYDGRLSVSVSGAGELFGADAERLAAGHPQAEGGIAFAFVRTAEQAGEIQITAFGEGLAPARAVVRTAADRQRHLPGRRPAAWRRQEAEPSFPQEAYLELPCICRETGAHTVRWAYGTCAVRAAVVWNAAQTGISRLSASADGVSWRELPAVPVSREAAAFFLPEPCRFLRCPQTAVRPELSAYGLKEEEPCARLVPPEQIAGWSCSGPCAPGRGPDKLFDGETRIGTGWLSESDTLPQSVTVRFSTPLTLCGSQIFWEKDSSWYRCSLEVFCRGTGWHTAVEPRLTGGQDHRCWFFRRPWEETEQVRLTLHEVIAGSGIPRTGAAEWRLYTK